MPTVLSFTCALVSAACVALSNEITARQGAEVITWLRGHFKYFAANTVIHTAALLLLTAASGGHVFAFALGALISCALANVSFFKYAARNEVLYASDFLLFTKVMSVSDKNNLFFTGHNALGLFLCLLSVAPGAVAEYRFPDFDVSRRLFFCVTALAFALGMYHFIKRDSLEDFTYFTKGFTLGLISNAYLYFTEDLSAPEAADTKPKQPAAARARKLSAPVPNVIVLLSESFWDITQLPGLRFSEPVVPNFRRLAEHNTHGSLIVTPFGGGTCNVEAELLTGAPIRYFNISNSFYHRYITHPILSLPRIFSQNGYETAALHTFDKDFYNRSTAFSHLGFDAFTAKEDLTAPVYEGLYIADSELAGMIIKSFEAKRKPAFILGISMENHQPYSPGKYAENPIRLLNGDIKPGLKSIAEAYAHGLRDADAALATLIRYFEGVDEPTDILFFGDHLGALGPLFELYRATGFISPRGRPGLDGIKKMYSTEFVLWSNYKSGQTRHTDTGSNFLGNILLNRLGFEKPELYDFMDEVYEKWHCVNRRDLFIAADGRLYGELPKEFAAMDEKYRELARSLILS